MFNIEKASIKAKAIPLLKQVLENEGKKPNFDNVQVLNDLYVEKFGKASENFNDLFLFRESLVSKYSNLYEAEKQYNAFVVQFDNILLTETKFSKLCEQIAEHFMKIGVNALRVNVNGLQVQAQFARGKNEFVNFSTFSTTFNPSQIQPKVKTTIANPKVTLNEGHSHAVTIEGVQYKNFVQYANSMIAQGSMALKDVEAFDKSLGKNRIHTPKVKAWLVKHKNLTF